MKNRIINNKLLKKFLSFSIGNWIVLLISLISTPILTRLLTPEEFGTFSLFLLVINLFSIIVILGLDQSLIRYFYEIDVKERQNLLSVSLFACCFMFIIISIILFCFHPLSTTLLFERKSINILYYFIIALFFSVINRFHFVLLRMEQKARTYSMLQIIQKTIDFLSFLCLYFIFLKDSEKLYVIIYAYIFSTFTVFIIGTYYNKSYIKINILKYKLNFSKLKPLLLYGIPLSITILITWIFQFIDRFMIKYYMGSYEVGLYAAAFKFVAIINIIQTSFTTFWVPVSNEQYIQDKDNKLFFEKMFTKVLIVMVCIGTLIILSKDILIIFFGEEFNNAVELIPMLLLIPIMYTMSEISVVGINFMRKTKLHILISVIICIICIVMHYIFIPLFGLKGAALSTGITYILYFLLRSYFGLKQFYFKAFTIKNILILVSFICFCSIIFIIG